MAYVDKETGITSQIYDDGILNIFTDASINPLGNNKWDGCAGAIPTHYEERSLTIYEHGPTLMVIRDCTNNIAELSAIELACDIALKKQTEYHRINVFSDSEYSVKTLKQWIFGWAKISCRNIGVDGFRYMKKSDGMPVKNNTIILNIINKILSIDPKVCQFNIYHVKAHTDGDYKKVQSQFLKANGIRINDCDAKILGYFNDEVDNKTRDLLLSEASIYYERKVVPYAIVPYGFNDYKRIIGGREF